jgi:hypothetical protein
MAKSSRGMKLTTHLNLAGVKDGGAIPPFPHVFMTS